jgi:hypothetical protein
MFKTEFYYVLEEIKNLKPIELFVTDTAINMKFHMDWNMLLFISSVDKGKYSAVNGLQDSMGSYIKLQGKHLETFMFHGRSSSK